MHPCCVRRSRESLFEDNYSYVVTVTDSQPKAIFIADTSGDTFKKIPQTVRFDRDSFSIICDLKLRRGNSTVYALVHPKGSITISKAGIPSINGKTGKPLHRTRK